MVTRRIHALDCYDSLGGYHNVGTDPYYDFTMINGALQPMAIADAVGDQNSMSFRFMRSQ
jgi:hypothetical protein